MNRKRLGFLIFVVMLLLPFLLNCGTTDTLNPQQMAEVPFGEPAFPNLGEYWVIDSANVLRSGTEEHVDIILENTRAAGYAEQAIVLMTGVSKTVEYTTQLGRHLRLGEASGPNKDNGLIWTLYTDLPSDDVLHYSAGDGLGVVDAQDIDEILASAQPFVDVKDWDAAVIALATKSAEVLERERSANTPTETAAESSEEAEGLTSEQQAKLGKTLLIAFAVWTVFCFALGFITGDWETAFELWFLIIRIVLVFAGSKDSGKQSSGSGSFSGRSR